MFFKKETIKKILRNRKKLETKLKVKLEIKENNIEIYGNELYVYISERVLEALEKNFPVDTALLLVEEDYVLEEIPIKSITNKKTSLVKARIIGTKGKTLKIITELSDCYLSLDENTVYIIGTADKIKNAVNAIKSLIKGSKQANVYEYLERHRKKPFLEELGLKE